MTVVGDTDNLIVMKKIIGNGHNEVVIDQFTKQAVPFSERMVASGEKVLERMIELSRVSGEDTILDVACGPGIVACAFASRAKRVTGIDLTPAMIDRAKKLQAEKGLSNLEWVLGDVNKLPFPDASFSLVLTRYSFHHFTDPAKVLSEMIRVCRPSGRVLIADVSPPEEKGRALDHVERLMDPSHTTVLSPATIRKMLSNSGLSVLEFECFSNSEMDLEEKLKTSFPKAGDLDKARKLFKEDVGRNLLGVYAHIRDNKIYANYPIVIVVGEKILSL